MVVLGIFRKFDLNRFIISYLHLNNLLVGIIVGLAEKRPTYRDSA